MTTLTSMIRPAAPAFRVASRLPAVRGLVVFCVSAIVAATFVLDLTRGASTRPERQAVQQTTLRT